jgi:hypothetical protein
MCYERELSADDGASETLAGMKVVLFKRLKDWTMGEYYRLSLEQAPSDETRALYFVEKFSPDQAEPADVFDPGLWEVQRACITYPNRQMQSDRISTTREKYAKALFSREDKREAWVCVCSTDVGRPQGGQWNVWVEKVLTPRLFLRKQKSPVVDTELPSITERMGGPTEYRLRVDGATAPFWLVFNESFHPGWKLSVKNRRWTQAPSIHHQEANGYANAWMVDPAKTDGKRSFELKVEYTPQRWFDLAWIWMGIWGLWAIVVMLRRAPTSERAPL